MTKKIVLIIGVLVGLMLIGVGLFFLVGRDGSVGINSTRTGSGERQGLGGEKEAGDGLVVHWTFDERGGGIISDAITQQSSGEVVGASWVQGVRGQALYFDGVDDLVKLDDKVVQKVGQLEYGTIAFWFKFKKPTERSILPMFYLGKIKNQKMASNVVIEIGHFDHGGPPDRKLYYTIYNKPFEPVLCFDSGENLKPNTWYHFAAVNSPTGNTGYLNGKEMVNRHYNFSTADSTTFLADLSPKEIARLGWGYFGVDQQFYYFNGALDDFRIYDRPLTSEEIKGMVASSG